MLSHSKHVVSFAPCTCVQASTLHPGTKTAYRFTNSELSCLLYDSCLEDKFQTGIYCLIGTKDKNSIYQIRCRYTKGRNLKGFFLLFELNSMQFLYAVLTILLDEISLPKVSERNLIKNEKKTEFLTT